MQKESYENGRLGKKDENNITWGMVLEKAGEGKKQEKHLELLLKTYLISPIQTEHQHFP